MDKNDSSIYIYYPSDYYVDQKKIETIVQRSFIMLYILIWVSNIESIRSLFYMTSITREVRVVIIKMTIYMQLLLVLFYKRNFTKFYKGDKKNY